MLVEAELQLQFKERQSDLEELEEVLTARSLLFLTMVILIPEEEVVAVTIAQHPMAALAVPVSLSFSCPQPQAHKPLPSTVQAQS